MKCGIRVEFIGNSGLWIEYGEVKLMIDGIFEKTPMFSQMPFVTKKAVFGMDSKYRNADYILFTHRHNDHFSGKLLREYLKNNSVKGVYIPEMFIDQSDGMEDQTKLETTSHRTIVHELEKPFGEELRVHLAEGVCFCSWRTTHIGGREFEHTKHYIYELSLDGVNFLFTADANPEIENFKLVQLRDAAYEAVFVNTLFYGSRTGQTLLNNLLRPGAVVIYHLPFEEDDSSNLRRLADHNMQKSEGNHYRTTLLRDIDQVLLF